MPAAGGRRAGDRRCHGGSIVHHATAPPPPFVWPLWIGASANPNPAVAPATVQFTSSVWGGAAPYTYTWQFGNGAFGTGASATHTYNTPSTYTAWLTVSDSVGNIAQTSVTVTVIPATLFPTLAATPRSGVAALAVSFTMNVKSPYTPAAGSYQWTLYIYDSSGNLVSKQLNSGSFGSNARSGRSTGARHPPARLSPWG